MRSRQWSGRLPDCLEAGRSQVFLCGEVHRSWVVFLGLNSLHMVKIGGSELLILLFFERNFERYLDASRCFFAWSVFFDHGFPHLGLRPNRAPSDFQRKLAKLLENGLYFVGYRFGDYHSAVFWFEHRFGVLTDECVEDTRISRFIWPKVFHPSHPLGPFSRRKLFT